MRWLHQQSTLKRTITVSLTIVMLALIHMFANTLIIQHRMGELKGKTSASSALPFFSRSPWGLWGERCMQHWRHSWAFKSHASGQPCNVCETRTSYYKTLLSRELHYTGKTQNYIKEDKYSESLLPIDKCGWVCAPPKIIQNPCGENPGIILPGLCVP